MDVKDDWPNEEFGVPTGPIRRAVFDASVRGSLACTEKMMDTGRRGCPNVQRRGCAYRVACSGARCTISMRAPHGSVI